MKNRPLKKRTITQRDVAQAAGVSQETVSQILRGVGRFSDDTRQRVNDTARELGYRHNMLARAVRQGRTCTIALLTTPQDGISFLPHEMLKAIEVYLSDNDQFLSICALPPGYPDNLTRVPAALGTITADGMLINITHGISPELHGHIARHAPPAVWLNAKLDSNCVYPDDCGAFADATVYLHSHGVPVVSYVDCLPNDRQLIPNGHYSETDRRAGYLQGAASVGMTPTLLAVDDLNTETLRQLVASAPGGRAALLCYERNEALRAMLVGLEAGLSLPEQLIIAYPSERAFYDPQLDSILRHIPIPEAEVAEAALRSLNRRIQQPDNDAPATGVPYPRAILPTLLDRSLHYAR